MSPDIDEPLPAGVSPPDEAVVPDWAAELELGQPVAFELDGHSLEAELLGFSDWDDYQGLPVVRPPDDIEFGEHVDLLVLREEDLVEDGAGDGGQPTPVPDGGWPEQRPHVVEALARVDDDAEVGIELDADEIVEELESGDVVTDGGTDIEEFTVGTRVKSLRDFSGVPEGTEGVVDEDYGPGVMVAWDLPDKPLPKDYRHRIPVDHPSNPDRPMTTGPQGYEVPILRDGFSKETELQFLEIVDLEEAQAVTDGGIDYYPEGVECPNCSAPVGEPCQHTDSDGRTGISTVVPHQERDELARELRTDGGRDVDDIEVLAAERYDGDDPCAYECENTADWIVEVRGQTRVTFKCCDSCGSANRIHPRDVERYEIGQEIATDGGQPVPERDGSTYGLHREDVPEAVARVFDRLDGPIEVTARPEDGSGGQYELDWQRVDVPEAPETDGGFRPASELPREQHETEPSTELLSKRVLTWFFIAAVGLHGPVDVGVTTAAWLLESNQVVLELGLWRWVGVKIVALAIATWLFFDVRKDDPTLLLPLSIGWLALLAGLGIAIVLWNLSLLLAGVLG